MIHGRWLLLLVAATVVPCQLVVAHPGHTHPGSEPVAKLNNAAMRQWMAEDPSRSEWGTFVTADRKSTRLNSSH